MSKYVTTHGVSTKSNDPQREMWYSTQCSYWTDDWSKLGKFGPGIPCCPQCGCPGYQSMYQKWDKGAKDHDIKEPGYYTFLQEVKEKCFGHNNSIGVIWKMKQDGKNKLDGALKDFLANHSKSE